LLRWARHRKCGVQPKKKDYRSKVNERPNKKLSVLPQWRSAGTNDKLFVNLFILKSLDANDD